MNDLVKLLADKGLPLLATAVGGPLAGGAVEWIAGKLGLSEKTVAAVTQAVQGMSPQESADLKKLDYDFKMHMADNGLKLELAEKDAEKSASEQVSARWQADATSDSWWSKNVRPLALAWWTVAITLMAFASEWVKVDALWIDVIKYSYLTVLSAYFIGRSVQHVTSLYGKHKTAQVAARK